MSGWRALLREQEPSVGRLWIRYAPRHWPAPALAWSDLAAGTLGAVEGSATSLEPLAEQALDDLLYLPPVPADLAERRDRLASRHAARGTPVLVHCLPGDPPPVVVEGVTVVVDLTPLALAPLTPTPMATGELGEAASAKLPLAAADLAVWPLVPGVPAPAGGWEGLATRVRAAGIGGLQGIVVEPTSRERRLLADRLSSQLAGEVAEDAYLALFHAAAPDPGDLAGAAVRHGLQPLLPRPLPRPPLHGAANLRLAGELATLSELCSLAGEPETRAQALLRAARFAERTPHELEALVRDGNLGVLPWLEGEARQVVEDAVRERPAALAAQLLATLAQRREPQDPVQGR